MNKILVLGLTGAGRASLGEGQVARVLQADLLVGGDRHLGYFPEFVGERLSVRAGMALVHQRVQEAYAAKRRIVVLASGDPLCYGIGTSLRHTFAADALEIVPAPSSYQLAFAALSEPWHDAALLSAHGRPLQSVVTGVLQAEKAAILTDDQHTPAVIAQALLAAGLSGTSRCAVCENLGEADEQITRTTLAEVVTQAFAPLNVFVVWRSAGAEMAPRLPPGIADTDFSTTGGLLTQREVRLLSLAEIALQPGEIFWDLGAGSGAVSIEAGRWQPMAEVYAVERRTLMCDHIRENLRRFPTANVFMIEGTAPAICATLPDPHAIFIGGSGGHLGDLIALAQTRLRPGGRLVLALVTLENIQVARAALSEARLVQVQISVGVPILAMLRLEAENPITIVSWKRP